MYSAKHLKQRRLEPPDCPGPILLYERRRSTGCDQTSSCVSSLYDYGCDGSPRVELWFAVQLGTLCGVFVKPGQRVVRLSGVSAEH